MSELLRTLIEEEARPFVTSGGAPANDNSTVGKVACIDVGASSPLVGVPGSAGDLPVALPTLTGVSRPSFAAPAAAFAANPRHDLSNLAGFRYLPAPDRIKMAFALQSPELRFEQFVHAWLSSTLLQPTDALTLRLAAEDGEWALHLAAAIQARKALLNAMRDWFRRRGHPFILIWSMEFKKYVHLHVANYVDERIRFEFLTWLCDWYGIEETATQSRIELIRQKNSGLPAHASKIREELYFGGSVNRGARGWLAYMAKDVERTFKWKKKKRCWVFDASTPIKALAHANFEAEVRKLWFVSPRTAA